MNIIRILLVEDHFLARTALISIVSRREEMKIVAIAENGADAITQYFQHHPDVTMMDLRLPGPADWRPFAPSATATPERASLCLPTMKAAKTSIGLCGLGPAVI